MATKTKTKPTTEKKSKTKINSQEEPIKLTKKQIEAFAIHEEAAKAGGKLAKAGILKPYKKPI